MDSQSYAGRICRAADDSGGGGGDQGIQRGTRMTRPLVPGIPSRVVDPSGVVKQRSQNAGARSPREAPKEPAEERPRDGELTIGRGVVFNGTIHTCDSFVVQGEVEATLPARAFQITETGHFKGRAEVDEAIVAGTFDGTLTVRGRLTVEATGRVRGTVRYGELAIVAGGQISGDIQVASEAPAPASDAGGGAEEAPEPNSARAQDLPESLQPRVNPRAMADTPET